MKSISMKFKLYHKILGDWPVPVEVGGIFMVETVRKELRLNETVSLNLPSLEGTPIKAEVSLHEEGIDVCHDDASDVYWRIESVEVLEEC